MQPRGIVGRRNNRTLEVSPVVRYSPLGSTRNENGPLQCGPFLFFGDRGRRRTRYAHCVWTRALTLEELRVMVGALDPDVLAAEGDVDRTLITLSLERSPLERVRFSQQMLETLMSFKRVEPSGL